MAVISESDLNELRNFQRSLMDVTCRVERPQVGTGGELDTESGRVTRKDKLFIYEGPCRVSTTRGPRYITVGEGVVVMGETDIFIPYDVLPVPRADDLVTITAAPDPGMVNNTLTVNYVPMTQFPTARKMTCMGIAPSRLTEQKGRDE